MDELGAARADAKRLLRVSRTGALATLDEERPLVTLVGVASDWDGAPLFLVSDLSRHARNLSADPASSLLLTSGGGRGDPLNHPRLTLIGRVVRREGADGRERYLRRNPKSKLYIGFADFTLRRLEIERVHFNGGFGRAGALSADDLLTPGDFGALRAAETELLARAAGLDDATLSRLAGVRSARGPFRPVGLDAEGLDLSVGGQTHRIAFPAQANTPHAWWAALTDLG